MIHQCPMCGDSRAGPANGRSAACHTPAPHSPFLPCDGKQYLAPETEFQNALMQLGYVLAHQMASGAPRSRLNKIDAAWVRFVNHILARKMFKILGCALLQEEPASEFCGNCSSLYFGVFNKRASVVRIPDLHGVQDMLTGQRKNGKFIVNQYLLTSEGASAPVVLTYDATLFAMLTYRLSHAPASLVRHFSLYYDNFKGRPAPLAPVPQAWFDFLDKSVRGGQRLTLDDKLRTHKQLAGRLSVHPCIISPAGACLQTIPSWPAVSQLKLQPLLCSEAVQDFLDLGCCDEVFKCVPPCVREQVDLIGPSHPDSKARFVIVRTLAGMGVPLPTVVDVVSAHVCIFFVGKEWS